ncbi:hypothetical protein, partial [Enterococcus casseliflavus]|uniref:hypothetical protein n=1 Tax=Enterococcus casseliflavus TaxID=37734 RepID=UPI003D096850
ALLAKLAEQVSVGEDDVAQIGRGRAEIVRAALIELGVDASRVRVDGAERAVAGGQGVPTMLTLRARD